MSFLSDFPKPVTETPDADGRLVKIYNLPDAGLESYLGISYEREQSSTVAKTKSKVSCLELKGSSTVELVEVVRKWLPSSLGGFATFIVCQKRSGCKFEVKIKATEVVTHNMYVFEARITPLGDSSLQARSIPRVPIEATKPSPSSGNGSAPFSWSLSVPMPSSAPSTSASDRLGTGACGTSVNLPMSSSLGRSSFMGLGSPATSFTTASVTSPKSGVRSVLESPSDAASGTNRWGFSKAAIATAGALGGTSASTSVNVPPISSSSLSRTLGAGGTAGSFTGFTSSLSANPLDKSASTRSLDKALAARQLGQDASKTTVGAFKPLERTALQASQSARVPQNTAGSGRLLKSSSTADTKATSVNLPVAYSNRAAGVTSNKPEPFEVILGARNMDLGLQFDVRYSSLRVTAVDSGRVESWNRIQGSTKPKIVVGCEVVEVNGEKTGTKMQDALKAAGNGQLHLKVKPADAGTAPSAASSAAKAGGGAAKSAATPTKTEGPKVITPETSAKGCTLTVRTQAQRDSERAERQAQHEDVMKERERILRENMAKKMEAHKAQREAEKAEKAAGTSNTSRATNGSVRAAAANSTAKNSGGPRACETRR